MLGELDKIKQGLMLQWHLKCKIQLVHGELSSQWLHGEQLTILKLRHGAHQIKMEVRLKTDQEVRDALNVAKKAICHENVLMAMEDNLERELASNVETKAICLENAQMVTMEKSPEAEAVSNAGEKDIELKTALENKLMLNLKMMRDLKEEDASSVEMKVIEQETVLEKEENNLKNKDQDEAERMKIQT